MKTAIRLSVWAGLSLAVVFVGIWHFYPRLPADTAIQIENIQLVLWPGSIFLLAAVPASTGEHLFLYGTAIGLNLLLYAAIGSAWWLGAKRRIWWPGWIVGGLVILIWLRVFTL